VCAVQIGESLRDSFIIIIIIIIINNFLWWGVLEMGKMWGKRDEF
jgi:hypothetical protein